MKTLTFGLLALGGALASHAPARQLAQDLTFDALDSQTGDRFAQSIDTDGAYALAGAPNTSDLGAASGSVYLIELGTSTQLQELHASDGVAGDQFGTAVALDGSLALVGAPRADAGAVDSGAVYVFDTTTGAQLHKLVASDATSSALFGGAVAMAGGRIVVGAAAANGIAAGKGAAYVFDASTGVELFKLTPGDESFLGGFGNAVAISGNRIVVGARSADSSTQFSGAAYVFDATSGAQLHKLQPLLPSAFGSFGCSVAIDGGRIAVGAKDESPKGKESGSAYLFDAASGAQLAKLFPTDGTVFDAFGTALDLDGDLLVVSAPLDFPGGSAYRYDAATGAELAKLQPDDGVASDEVGAAVAVAGGVAVIGAPDHAATGAGYVYAGGAAVAPMAGCLTNAGLLAHTAGLPVPGSSLGFALDGAQPGATLGVLAFSTAPVAGWPSCGQVVPGAGELLLDLAPGTLQPFKFVPYAGVPAALDVAVPPIASLAGLTVYAQGALVAPASLEPLRLTSALTIQLGGLF